MQLVRKLAPRLVGIAGLAASIYLAVVLIQTIRHNASLKTEISQLEKEVNQLKEDKEELTYRLQYYQTDAFKEKEARAKLGLQKPGENLVILPRETQADKEAEAAKAKPKAKVPNWILWWRFLFG